MNIKEVPLMIADGPGFKVGDRIYFHICPGVEFFVAPGKWIIPKHRKQKEVV